jgi:hypothetical protein
MAITKDERWASLHAESKAEFERIQAAQREERMQALQDRRFYLIAGAQWEGPLGEQFENKPRFEFNKVHLSVIRIINEYRNNRITVDFQPKDGATGDDLADVCDGLYRADEKSCSADEAYDNAFEEGVGGGYGAWRLRTCYEDEEDDENDRQRIVMEPIYDADSCVFFDLGAKRQDKADAKRCYVLVPYTRDDYLEEFDDDPDSWPKAIEQGEFDWCTPDFVWVCELYRVEEKTELVHFFRGLNEDEPDMRVLDSELKADPGKLDFLTATGFREVRKKRVKTRRIHKYLFSGGGILEDCGIIAGRCIPIVPVFGKRSVVDGIERCMGHVRLAKDAQRLQNVLMSSLAELAARFDVEKPIFTPEQIAGHTTMWAEDNVKKYPFLLTNALLDIEGNPIPGSNLPMGYTKAPSLPPAVAALAQIGEQALSDLLGNQQAGEQMQPNISGKAVELIQNRLDMQVFIYMSNLAKAMKRGGEIWLSMAKDILIENDRRMKIIDSGGESSSVVLNQAVYDEETASERLDNDLSKAALEVDVDVGPSSSSKRAATVRALTGMKQGTTDPETISVLDGLIMMNMEGEGLSEARQYFRRKLVRMGVVKPTDDEIAEMQAEQANAQPDPQAQYLLAAAGQADADAAQSRAKTVDTIASADLKRAQTDETRAKTAETYAKTMGEHYDQQLASAQVLQDILKQPAISGAD